MFNSPKNLKLHFWDDLKENFVRKINANPKEKNKKTLVRKINANGYTGFFYHIWGNFGPYLGENTIHLVAKSMENI